MLTAYFMHNTTLVVTSQIDLSTQTADIYHRHVLSDEDLRLAAAQNEIHLSTYLRRSWSGLAASADWEVIPCPEYEASVMTSLYYAGQG